jgi:CRP-like cAMP-binding protein
MGLFEGRKNSAALAKLEDAKKRHLADPANAALANALADAYLGAGSRQGAIEVLTRTGSALSRDGQAATAAAVLARVQQIDPSGELPSTFLALHALREARAAAEKAAAAPAPPPSAEPAAAPPSAKREAVRAAAAAHPALQGLPAGIVSALVGELAPRVFPSGAVLFAEGDGGSALYFVTAGELALFGKDDSGRESPLGTIGPGEVAGEIAFLTGRPRSVTARATRRTEALVLEHVAAEPILKRHKKLSDTLAQLARRRGIDLMLAKSRVFRTLAPDERDFVARRLTPLAAKPGDRLVREGAKDSDFFLLKSGQLEVTKESRGRQVLLALLEPYDCFGETAARSATPQTATVTALTAVEYFALKKTDLAEIVKRNPSVKSALEALQMERFVETARLLSG